MANKGRRCEKGASCGKTCISKGFNCFSKSGAEANKVLAMASELIDGATGTPKINMLLAFGEKLGQGSYGVVKLTDKGTAYKAYSAYGGEFESTATARQDEVINAKMAGELGIGPKVLSINRNGGVVGYEMEFLIGYKSLDRDIYDVIASGDKTASGLVRQLAKLHANGMAHGDLHEGNIMVSPKGKVKLIDYGLSATVKAFPKTAPRMVLEDDMMSINPKHGFKDGTVDQKIHSVMLKFLELSKNKTEAKLTENYEFYIQELKPLLKGIK